MSDRKASRRRLSRWFAVSAAVVLAACSEQVPIGEQNGRGGTAQGAAGSTGPGTAGSGGIAGSAPAGSSGSAGTRGAGGASGSLGAAGSTDASVGPDAALTCEETFASQQPSDCVTDASCNLRVHDDCCGTVVTGNRRGGDDLYDVAESIFQSCVPGCATRGCSHPDVAQDGNAAGAGQTYAVRCVAKRCTSYVTAATTCVSNADCSPGQTCTAFVTNVGPTSSTKLECRANLCGDRQLSCTCASSACAGFGAAVCNVTNDRLTCDDGRQ